MVFMKLTEMTVEAYLALLSSDAPAPGGGSAAALCGAQGAGLAAMAAGLTVRSPKYDGTAAQRLQEDSLAQVQKLQDQIDRDADAFHLVSAAYKLPKDSDEARQKRSQAIQAGTLASTQAPLETMAVALEALQTARTLLGQFNANAASDLGVAALNLLAAVKGAWLNVLINTGSLKDRQQAEDCQRKGQSILQEAEALAAEIYQALEAALWDQ